MRVVPRLSLFVAVAIAVAAMPVALAWAFGADHPEKPVTNPKWPAGLSELVNVDNRVHGYFVNFEDVFFFRGDTRSLNAFLERYAKLPGAELRVVLHPGKLAVRSPWDKQSRAAEGDWKLYASPLSRERVKADDFEPRRFHTRVDVWLGGSVTLDGLQVPDNVSVESGGEIEAFVQRSRERSRK